MKILFCPVCQDLIKLQPNMPRTCMCGASHGKYLDKLNAEIGGKAIALGIDNHSFLGALRAFNRGKAAREELDIHAFIIETPCNTIQVNKA